MATEVQNNIVGIEKAATDLTNALKPHIDILGKTIQMYTQWNAQLKTIPSEYLNNLNNMAAANEKVANSQKKVVDATIQAEKARKAEADANKAVILQQKAAIDLANKEIAQKNRNTQAVDRHARKVYEESRSYRRLQTEWREAQATYADFLTLYGEQNKATIKARQEFEKLNQKIKQVDESTRNYSKNVGNYKSAIGGLGSLTSQLAGALGWVGAIGMAVNLGKSFYETTKQLQVLNKTMELGAKDSAAYASNIQFLDKITEDYGLEILTTTQAYNKFYIASKNKLALNEIQDIFSKISKSASLMGLSVDDQEGIFRALEQMMSKGTVQAEELRGQLGDRLPGAFEIMAKAAGVSTEELTKMMENGEVMAADVLPKFAVELEKAFGADQVKKVENLAASENRLKNEWTDFVKEMNGGNSVITMTFSNFYGWIAQMIKGLSRLTTFIFGVNQAVFTLGYAIISIGGEIVDFGSVVKKVFSGDFDGAKDDFKKNVGDIVKIVGQGKKAIRDLLSNTGANMIDNEGNSSIREAILREKNATNEIVKVRKESEKERKKRLAAEKKAREKAKKEAEKAAKEAEKQRLEYLQRDYQIADQLIQNELKVTKNFEDQIELRRKATALWFLNEISKTKGTNQELLLLNTQFAGKMRDIDNEVTNNTEKKNKEREEGQKKLAKSVSKTWKTVTDYINKILDDANEEAKKKTKERIDWFKGIGSSGFSFSDFGFGSFDIFSEPDAMEKFYETMTDSAVSAADKAAAAMSFLGNVTADVFASMKRRSDAYYENEFAKLEKEKDLAIKYAGENTAGREALEKRYDERKLALKRQQAQQEKKMAIFEALINVAKGVVKAIAENSWPYNLVIAGLVGALGAVQIANIQSQPLPQFWKGTDNAPEGWAIVDELRPEIHTDKKGNVKSTGSKKGANLRYLEKGDKIFPSHDAYFRELHAQINMSGSFVDRSGNLHIDAGITKEDLKNVMEETIGNQPKVDIMFDVNGFTKRVTNGYNRTISKKRRIT